MNKRFLARMGAAVSCALVAATAVAMPAEAAHYQGGDYGICIYPENGAYHGVWVEGYGLGSDTPYRNATIVAYALVQAANQCQRQGAVHYVQKVQIDKVALRRNGVNYYTRGPFNNGTNKVSATSGNATPPCGQYFQSAQRWSVRYTNGALFSGHLNSGGFKRC